MSNVQLMSEGRKAIEKGDYKHALVVAKKLHKAGYSGAFELKALAQAAQNEKAAAIETLREGVKVAPQVWLLWNLLGNYLSDEGQYLEACLSFEQALGCQKVDVSCIRLNWSVALARWEKPSEALVQIEMVANGKYVKPARVQKLALFTDLGRYEKAIALGKSLLSTLECETSDTAIVRARIAQCFWRWKKDRAVALENVFKALEINDEDEFTLGVLREIEDRRSPKAMRFKGLVEFDCAGFGYACTAVRSFHAVADNEEELLDDLRRLEWPEHQSSFHLHKVELEESCPGMLKGVYWRSVIVTSPKSEKA